MRKASAFVEDLRRYREPYFYTLFPDAAVKDYAVLARVADREPLSELADLQRAGEWLLRLAQTPDRFLRQRMARRWWATCLRSAHLGLGCYRLYQRIAPQFGLAINGGAFILWMACVLRLKTGSRRKAALRWLQERLVQK